MTCVTLNFKNSVAVLLFAFSKSSTMPSASNKLSQIIAHNYKELSEVLNTPVSYVNLIQGRRDARQNFVCVRKVFCCCASLIRDVFITFIIIFLQARAITSKPIKTVKSPKTPVLKEHHDEDLDLTGSPLKDDFELEVVNMSIATKDDHYKIWSDTEETYSGISVDTARAIVSELADMEEEDEGCPRMWILCNGLDAEKTLLLENEMNDGWWTTGVVQLKEPVIIEMVKMDQLTPVHLNSYPGRLL